MLKRIIKFAWNSRNEITKYLIVGVSGLAIDIGTLTILKENAGLTPVLAVVLNQLLMLAYNFSLNKYWSFRNRDMPHWQLIRYLMLAGWNYIFSVGSMYFFHQQFGFEYRLVRIASIAVMTLWNFALYKFWVYQKERPVTA